MAPVNEQMLIRGDSLSHNFTESTIENLSASLRRFYQLRVEAGVDNNAVRPRRALIAGDVERGYQLAKKLKQHFPQHYSIVGFVSPDPQAVSPNGIPVLGQLDSIADLARNHEVDDVLIADFLIPEFHEIKDEVAAQTEALRKKAEAVPTPKSGWYSGVKRGLDFAFALLVLALSAPLLALAALAVKLTSPGPVIFGQERVGLHGKSFTIYKFRTMRVDAESQTGPVLARYRDSRCTPIGSLMRATKIDELPQLFNVLRGDMSIVGPRPERPCFVNIYNDYVPNYVQRHEVLPGLTGLAQIKGDHLIHVNVKLHYDLVYAYNLSPVLDAKLLFLTPFIILKSMLSRGEGC
jgi:lipopolysaccharide/colanic/teichoic acid biosynthesis glycosyltransferase